VNVPFGPSTITGPMTSPVWRSIGTRMPRVLVLPLGSSWFPLLAPMTHATSPLITTSMANSENVCGKSLMGSGTKSHFSPSVCTPAAVIRQ
jgi:hypothetical protein